MGKVFNTLTVFTVIIGIIITIMFCKSLQAEHVSNENEIHTAIVKLHPNIDTERSRNLSKIIDEHARFTNTPHPNFIVAIIERESSFSRQVEIGAQYGRNGDIGLMQVMPRGVAIQHMRQSRNDCDQTDANCNIMTGAMWLQEVREQCNNEDPWVWMAAYGTNYCPSSKAARRFRSAKNARRIFCKITDDCETHWPE